MLPARSSDSSVVAPQAPSRHADAPSNTTRRGRLPPVLVRFFWSLISRATGPLTTVVMLMTVARLIPPAEYGRASIILAVWQALVVVIGWCGGLIVRYGPIELEQQGTLKRTISTRLVFAWGSLGVLAIVTPVVAIWRDWSLALFVLTVCWILSSTIYDVLQWSANAAQSFRALAISSVFIKGTALIAIVALGLSGVNVTAQAFVVATLAGIVLASAVLYRALRPIVGVTRPDKALLKTMWRFSRPGLLGLPAVAAINSIDPLILDHWVALDQVGRYQLAYPVLSAFAAVGASVGSVLYPKLVIAHARGEFGAVKSYTHRSQPILAVLLGGAGFALAMLVEPVGGTLLPQRYAQSAEVMSILTIAGGYCVAVYTTYPVGNLYDRVWSIQSTFIVQGVVNTLADLALAPALGARGVALANVLAWASSLVLLTVLLRPVGTNWRSLPPLITGGALVTAWLMTRPPALLQLVIGSLSVACLCIAGVIAWRRLELRT